MTPHPHTTIPPLPLPTPLYGTREVCGGKDPPNAISKELAGNLFQSIAKFPEGDPAILKGQGGEALMEISTRDIIRVKN